MIEYYPLNKVCESYQQEIFDEINTVVTSGRYILGDQVKAFEMEYSKYVGSKYTLGVSNGLDALRMSIRSLNLPKQSKIGVPTHTFIATWLAVLQEGHELVPLEVDIGTLNLDPLLLTDELLNDLSAIILVHMHGSPVDLGKVKKIIDDRDIKIIHDAAQAHGATYSGYKIGDENLIGDCACWSYYPGKNLGAFGDAGGVTTSCAHIARSVKKLRNYGSNSPYYHEELGSNCRLDELQAAILRVRLRYLDKENECRRKQAKTYQNNLSGFVDLQRIPEKADSAFHHFIIRSNHRDRILHALELKGIQYGIHYPRACHEQPVFKGRFNSQIAEKISETILSLPLGTHIEINDVDYISDVIISAVKNV